MEPPEEVRRALSRRKLKSLLRSLGIAVGMPFIFSYFFGGAPLDLAIVISLSAGIPGGIVMEMIFTRLRPRLAEWPLFPKQVVLSLSLVGTLLTFIYFSIVAGDAYVSRRSPLNPDVLGNAFTALTSPFFLRIYGIAIMFLMASTLLASIAQILGPGVLWKLIIGKYHRPFDERRIFMFLDMRDSTTLAEQLGNVKFSKLVQDAFNDLTKAVVTTKCEVSHYIGDEAVLSWTVKNGTMNDNVVRFFRLYLETLESRRSHYMELYGFVPRFKAGAHIGDVVTTAVGQVKSEIVYHGDVMNTTARITGLCSELGCDFLVSGDLARSLGKETSHQYVDHGVHLLKGKEVAVQIFEVPMGHHAVQSECAVPTIGM